MIFVLSLVPVDQPGEIAALSRRRTEGSNPPGDADDCIGWALASPPACKAEALGDVQVQFLPDAL
jgi:hypothetical protein